MCTSYGGWKGCYKLCLTSDNCKDFNGVVEMCKKLESIPGKPSICVPTNVCTSDVDCPASKPLCMANICEEDIPGCYIDDDCPHGMTCDNFGLKAQCKAQYCDSLLCPEGMQCFKNRCLRVGTECSTHKDCNSNEKYCYNSKCITIPCTTFSSNDCDHYGECHAGICTDPCNHECAPYEICNKQTSQCFSSIIPPGITANNSIIINPVPPVVVTRPPGSVIIRPWGCHLCDERFSVCEDDKCVPNVQVRCPGGCPRGSYCEVKDRGGQNGGRCVAITEVEICEDDEYFTKEGCKKRSECDISCRTGYTCNIWTRTCEIDREECEQVQCREGDGGGQVCTRYDL